MNAKLPRSGIATVLLLMSAVLLSARDATAASFLYDDFNDPSHLVRADLWGSADTYSTGGVGSGRTDALSIIDALIFPTSNPKLLIGRRLVLQPGAVGGFDRDGYTMRNAPNVLGVQADVSMVVCSLSNPGLVQAGVQFYGFHDGTPGAATDSTGDILTRLRVSCADTNQAQITWNVFRCTNATCTTTSSLGSGTFGPANIGQEYTLRVTRSGSSFLFTAVGQTQSFLVPGNPTAPPKIPFNGLRTRIDPTTPTNGGDFIVAARFDNVVIDQ